MCYKKLCIFVLHTILFTQEGSEVIVYIDDVLIFRKYNWEETTFYFWSFFKYILSYLILQLKGNGHSGLYNLIWMIWMN